jgi:hypothetical protein
VGGIGRRRGKGRKIESGKRTESGRRIGSGKRRESARKIEIGIGTEGETAAGRVSVTVAAAARAGAQYM